MTKAQQKSEAAIMTDTMLDARTFNCRLFRNQVGRYEVDGRWITTGLCKGSSDLVGYHVMTVTPDMVGKKIAVFASIEVKRSKREQPEPDQRKFINAVLKAGGIAGVLYNPAHLGTIINRWYKTLITK